MKNVFKFFNFKKNTFIKRVKNIFEDKLSESNFTSNEFHLISNVKLVWPLYKKSCTKMSRPLDWTTRRCSYTDSWWWGPRWYGTRHLSTRWSMLWIHIYIWRMVCCGYKYTYSIMSQTKCFKFDKQLYQKDWSDWQVCWKKGLE